MDNPLQDLQLEQVIDVDSPTWKRLNLATFLEAKSNAQLVELLEESKTEPSDNTTEWVEAAILGELARKDPHEALAQLQRFPSHRRSDLVFTVFAEWSFLDLDDALSAANGLESKLRTSATASILSRRSDLSKADIESYATAYGFEAYAQQYFAKKQVLQLLDRPQEAFELVLSDAIHDSIQQPMLNLIASTWINREGPDAFKPLFGALLDLYSENYTAVGSVVAHIAKSDPQLAWKQMLSLPPLEQLSFHSTILRAWVIDDPRGALNALSEFNAPRKEYIRRNLLRIWAGEDPEELLDNLSNTAPEDRRYAIAYAIRELTRAGSVDSAIQYMNSLESRGEDTSEAKRLLVDSWSLDDPSSAVTWTLENTSDDLRQEILDDALPRLALVDPSFAVRVAGDQPLAESSYSRFNSAEVQIVKNLANNGQFDNALASLKKLRTENRALAAGEIGVALIDFNRPAEAVSLAQQFLPESEWEEYFGRLGQMWILINPAQFSANIAKFPNPSLRATGAEVLLREHDRSGVLTKEEAKQLKTFMISAQEE